jgi:phage shock protein PspC (stress-responsive transcriptional regulator)
MISARRRLHLSVNLVRPRANRMFLGVCAGLAARFEIDPVWVRIAFVALALLFGKGLLLYLILCVVMPSADDQSWSSRNSCTMPSEVR